MDFESPDVMKDFPGLYASDSHKNRGIDTAEADDEKVMRKDALIGKRKDKKDKKDKEKGYAALEGESSAEENCEIKSPSKSKKSKSFKFPTKSKEKREKSGDKEKEGIEKKKDRDKRTEKKNEKEREKCKSDKKEKKVKTEEWCDIADVLPIFGVNLKLAIERGRCHDGIDLPLPVRVCIEFIEKSGLLFEGVYKVNAPKSKVIHLKKLFNQRELVNLSHYDVPTATSLLKLFLRELSEPIFTNELLVRFEEAGAILNVAMREKHLKILIGNLPVQNRLFLSWLIVHLYNVILNEKYNKMNSQNISLCLYSTLQISQRLLQALLYHCPLLFPNVVLVPYVYPLTSSSQLPDDPELMDRELLKQESLLQQIHTEMNVGFISKQREELLWEVQRIITQLKRKLKIANKDKESVIEKTDEKQEEIVGSSGEMSAANVSPVEVELSQQPLDDTEENKTLETDSIVEFSTNEANISDTSSIISIDKCSFKGDESLEIEGIDSETLSLDQNLTVLLRKNDFLFDLKQLLQKQIESEKVEILNLKSQLSPKYSNLVINCSDTCCTSLDEIMDLLHKENQILQIKKINLVRQIVEQQEACIDLKIMLDTFPKNKIL